MYYLKRYKLQITLGTLLFLFVALFGYLMFSLMFPDTFTSLYGNRLVEIKQYKINDVEVTKMKADVLSTDKVNEVSYSLQGKIINIRVKVKDTVDKVNAKLLVEPILNNFTNDQKQYYDMQLFITSENKTMEGFPIIGYKHHTSVSFVWGNNSL